MKNLPEVTVEHRLRHPFWPVKTGHALSFGLNQQWSARPAMRGWGCGPAAAVMLLGYLRLHHPDGFSVPMEALPEEPSKEYCAALLDTVGRRHFPILPRFGMNGLSLAFCLNRYFHRHRMPFHAAWCCSREKALRRMEQMLDEDIPVIFSVGPDFPLLWQKHPLSLYASPDAEKPCASVRAHYMVAAGMTSSWLELSSWGHRYFLPLADWREHHRHHSGHLVDGIVYIRRKKRRKRLLISGKGCTHG